MRYSGIESRNKSHDVILLNGSVLLPSKVCNSSLEAFGNPKLINSRCSFNLIKIIVFGN